MHWTHSLTKTVLRGGAIVRAGVAGLGLALLACAPSVEPDRIPTGFGTVEVALQGTLPDVKRFRVRIYDTAVTEPTQREKFLPAKCDPYFEASGKPRNKLTISQLKVGTYSLLVELFADDGCTALRYRAYRGGLKIQEATNQAALDRPYYVQPYEIGKFTGLAGVFDGLLTEAAKKLCSSDADCKGVHVNATCTPALKCTVDHMYPLNGGDRRAFGRALALGDGRVLLAGGFTALKDGIWTATKDRAELYDPSTGLFRAQPVANAGFAVGLAESVTLAQSALAVVGGGAGLRFELGGGKLRAELDAKGCGVGTGAQCVMSKLVARWDLKDAKEGRADTFLQAAPLAFPAVGRMKTKDGERLLIAGGAPIPLSKTGSQRTGSAVLCKLDGASVGCSGDVPAMAVPRARAATACIQPNADGTCAKLLLLGGRTGKGALAEVFDADAGKFTEPAYKGAKPELLHGGELLRLGGTAWLLAGATKIALWLDGNEVNGVVDAEPIGLLRIVVTVAGADVTLEFAPVDLGAFKGADGGQRALTTGVALGDGSAIVIGGLGKDLKPIKDAMVVGADGTVRGRIDLGVARFGGSAVRIPGRGPTGGCVMLTGGFGLVDGVLQPQNHVEVYCPN
ncbi:MAG: hypothetical protein EXR79_12280 [Myxococcales bacterium]|nr:hypothetical protein [Myxococcales bacterium]